MTRRLFRFAVVAGASALAATSALADPAKGQAARPTEPLNAQACAGCHGQNGAGKGGTPILAGYDRAAFLRVWDELRNNQRPNTIMTRIARGYTEAEVAALAEWFASLRRAEPAQRRASR